MYTEEYDDISCGMDYCSKYGVTDLFDECKEKLLSLTNSNKAFDTGYCYSQKELSCARYLRHKDNDGIEVEINVWVDELCNDLIYDAMWEVLHTEDDVLSDDELDEFYTMILRDTDISDRVEKHLSFPVGTQFEYIMECMDQAETELNQELENMFQELQEYLIEFLKNKESGGK